jgi:regulator of protease activity HflC (stomatin/prohibitin superfamily)
VNNSQTLKTNKKHKKQKMQNSFKLIGTLVATTVLLIVLSLFVGYERIDAGHVGVKVNLYGDDKGVQSVTLVTGAVWYNPITTVVYEVPTFIQNAVYTLAETKGSPINEEFRVTTKDGLAVGFDVSINYYTPDSVVSRIFTKYRKPFDELQKTVMRNYLRDAFNSTAANYSASELYEFRGRFTDESVAKIREILGRDGFIVEQVVLLNELRLPDMVVKNIQSKVAAVQIAQQKQQELAQAQADAEKRIADARGIADSQIITARAEAEANRMRQATLTNLLIQQMWIEKWDGKLPTTAFGENMPVVFNRN